MYSTPFNSVIRTKKRMFWCLTYFYTVLRILSKTISSFPSQETKNSLGRKVPVGCDCVRNTAEFDKKEGKKSVLLVWQNSSCEIILRRINLKFPPLRRHQVWRSTDVFSTLNEVLQRRRRCWSDVIRKSNHEKSLSWRTKCNHFWKDHHLLFISTFLPLSHLTKSLSRSLLSSSSHSTDEPPIEKGDHFSASPNKASGKKEASRIHHKENGKRGPR